METMLFGAFGLGYLVYARRQRDPIALVAGVALCAYPYFVSNTYVMLAVGAAIMAAPFIIKPFA